MYKGGVATARRELDKGGMDPQWTTKSIYEIEKVEQ